MGRVRTWARVVPLLALVGCRMQAPDLPDRPAPLSADAFERVGRIGLRTSVGAPTLQEGPAVLGVPSPSVDEPTAEAAPRGALGLVDVLVSVETHFPVVLAARTEYDLVAAELLEARGAFDTRLGGGARNDFEGFYRNERYDVSLSQPTRLGGARFTGGYRLGSGSFDFYDEGDQTNDGGELRVGLDLPLLQGRAIDKARVAEWKAVIASERAQPVVEAERIAATLDAARAYWDWVAAGRGLAIVEFLLALAQNRQGDLETAAREGQLADIVVTDNQRLIVERRIRAVRAQRELEKAAIQLSLFLRDEDGAPVVPGPERLPANFPDPTDPSEVLVTGGVELALERRPEIRSKQLSIARLELDRDLAENDLLPVVDLKVGASQDLGAAASSPDDKDEFEVKAGLSFGVPLQRRAPRGRLRGAEVELVRQRLDLQFMQEKVAAEVADAVSALTQSWQRVGEARENVRLAGVMAEAERRQLVEGASDLFRVNLREQQAAIAQGAEVEVFSEHFRALARYRAVLGVPYDELIVDRP